MKLFNLIKSFRNDEDGAVTVDWVVLAAAVVGIGNCCSFNAVSTGVEDLSTDISNQLLNQEITTEFSSYRREYRIILARAAFGNVRGLRRLQSRMGSAPAKAGRSPLYSYRNSYDPCAVFPARVRRSYVPMPGRGSGQ